MSAVYALAGVVIGGILGGAVQLVVQRRNEKRALKTACRPVAYELVLVEASCKGALVEWDGVDLRKSLKSAKLEATWDEHRASLAAELPEDDWIAVSGVVLRIYMSARLTTLMTKEAATEMSANALTARLVLQPHTLASAFLGRRSRPDRV